MSVRVGRETITPTFEPRPKGTTTTLAAGRIEPLRHDEIEGLFERDVEGDAGDFHGAKNRPPWASGGLWITL